MTHRLGSLDAESTVYFEGELEKVIQRVYEKEYAELPFRRLLSINTELTAADQTVTYKIYDGVAMAKLISSYASDLPRADVSAREVSFKMYSIGTSFGYNIQEVIASEQTGKRLGQRRANYCMRATEERHNQIALYGDTETGLQGLLNNPNIPTSNAVTGTWSTATPQQILDDINQMFIDQMLLTKEYEQFAVILMPPEQWSLLHTTQLSSGSDLTIMQFLVKNSPWLTSENQIQYLRELKGAGTGGVDVMFAYDPNPDKVEYYIPLELEFLAPQPEGLEFSVPGWARTGGTHMYFPLSAAIVEDI